MARLNARPIVVAHSNSTDKHECLPADGYAWPQADAVYATGVQFPPVPSNGHIYQPV
ncbi:MAG: malic enzyme-like NAD(P)-binding protein [Synechococcaceae cyanobacterium]|jgi:malate dehydrogenase (oxaloacetate-decarboxylating)(NADP+)